MAHKSHALFHFTQKLDPLLSIIDKGFIPFYSDEEIDDLFGSEDDLFDSEKAFNISTSTFPLVSFCDIPLTSADRHIRRYGAFALGM